jgi:hypothetical protein
VNGSIKANAELRHVLAHIMSAIEELAHDRPRSALHELEGIEGLVLFRGDEEMEGYLNGEMHEEETASEAETEEEIGAMRRPGAQSNPGRRLV